MQSNIKMAKKNSRRAYLECRYDGKGMFSTESILSFEDSQGRSVSGYFHNGLFKEGRNEEYRLVKISLVRKKDGLVTIVLPNEGTFGKGGRGQGGFIDVKKEQIFYE